MTSSWTPLSLKAPDEINVSTPLGHELSPPSHIQTQSPRIMITRLPPELIHHIISFLVHNDRPSLFACSLSCSTLANVSKPLLFHTLRTSLRPGATDQFEHLLESSPTILPLVKRIEVTISTLEQGAAATVVAISQIMTQCHAQNISPSLNITIRPKNPHPHQFVESVLVQLGPLVDWVTSLHLDTLDLSEDVQFWDLVPSFPMLKSLVLGQVNVGQGGEVSSHTESKISHLALKESSLGGGCNICWFLADHPMPLPSLTSLDVRFPMAPDQSSIRFGGYYGPKVRTLRFGVVISRHSTKCLDGILDCGF